MFLVEFRMFHVEIRMFKVVGEPKSSRSLNGTIYRAKQ